MNGMIQWNDVKWYTSTLQGCKSAWGKSFEKFAHLIGNKHCLHYLASNGVANINRPTQDKILDSAQEQDMEERGFKLDKDRDYNSIVRHFNDVNQQENIKSLCTKLNSNLQKVQSETNLE